MIANLPLLVLSLVLVTLYASLAHLMWGRSFKNLGARWLAALLGLGIGQFIARNAPATGLPVIGQLHIVEASACSWLAILIAKQMRL